MMNIEKIRERLIDEYDVPSHVVTGMLEKVKKLQPEIAVSFKNWFENGELDDIEVEGYTVSRIMAERDMNPISAYLLLDWIKREPEMALSSMNILEFDNPVRDVFR